MNDKVRRREVPLQSRIRLVKTRPAGLGSALAEVQERFRSEESRNNFLEWRKNPVTLMMLEALNELARVPPVGYIDTEEIGVQYGVSSGLDLASSFLDDPSVLYPHLFTGAAPGPTAHVPTDYLADPLSTTDVPGSL